MTTTVELAKSFLAAREDLDAAESRLKECRRRSDALNRQLVDAMIEAGVDGLSVDGHAIYMRTDVFCNKLPDVTAEEAVDVVRLMGLGELVTTQVQPARIKAWAAETLRDVRAESPEATVADALPEPFLRAFGVTERVQAIARRKS